MSAMTDLPFAFVENSKNTGSRLSISRYSKSDDSDSDWGKKKTCTAQLAIDSRLLFYQTIDSEVNSFTGFVTESANIMIVQRSFSTNNKYKELKELAVILRR